MNYSSTVNDFFKSPKWMPNLLLGGVCILIPIVGPIALLGWHSGALYGRRDPYDFIGYPAFDFNKFGKYLERGVWPFLAQFIVSLVLIPFIWIVMLLPMGIAISQAHSGDRGTHNTPPEIPPAFIAAIVVAMFCVFLLIVALMLVIKPIMLRATITQDFGKAFSWRFIKAFIAKTWLDQLVSYLFLMFASILIMIVGMLIVCVGIYFSAGLIAFIQCYLDRQLYDLYIARGGEPIEVSPKLSDEPPQLPLGAQ